MKKYIATFVLALALTPLSAAISADNPIFKTNVETTLSTVPVNSVLNFNSDFPFATDAVWKSSEGKTFVEFKNKEGFNSYAVYENGTLKENYYGISANDLPLISKSHLNTKYPSNEIENAYIIRDGVTDQKILVELQGTEDVIYAMEGYFLRYQ